MNKTVTAKRASKKEPRLGSALLLIFASAHFISMGQTGTLDPDFSADGKVNIPFASGSVRGYATVPDWVPGGSYVAGYQYNSNDNSIAIVRLGADGSLVQSFDGDGKVLATYGTNEVFSSAYCVERCYITQTIVVAGESKQTANGVAKFGVAKFDAGVGTFDNTFSGDGRTTFDFVTGAPCRAWDVAIQQDDKIILAGWSNTSSDPDSEINFAVARLLPNGQFDNSFSSDGKVMIDFGDANAIGHSVVLQSDGKILIGGTREAGAVFIPGTTYPNFALARLNNDGTLDQSFGSQGKVSLSSAPTREGWDIEMQSDGKIVMAGFSPTALAGAPLIMRFNPNGSVDASFGTSGQVQIGVSDAKFYDIEVQQDGKLICSGIETYLPANPNGFIAWLNEDGSPDQTVGDNGKVYLDFGIWTDDGLRDAWIGNDGRVTVAGTTDLGDGVRQFAVARFYSLQVGVLGLDDKNRILRVYPNPIVESVVFEYELEIAERLTITLQDLQGKQLTTFMDGELLPAGEHRQVVSMPPDLASGNYLLVFSSPNGKTSIQVTK